MSSSSRFQWYSGADIPDALTGSVPVNRGLQPTAVSLGTSSRSVQSDSDLDQIADVAASYEQYQNLRPPHFPTTFSTPSPPQTPSPSQRSLPQTSDTFRTPLAQNLDPEVQNWVDRNKYGTHMLQLSA